MADNYSEYNTAIAYNNMTLNATRGILIGSIVLLMGLVGLIVQLGKRFLCVCDVMYRD